MVLNYDFIAYNFKEVLTKLVCNAIIRQFFYAMGKIKKMEKKVIDFRENEYDFDKLYRATDFKIGHDQDSYTCRVYGKCGVVELGFNDNGKIVRRRFLNQKTKELIVCDDVYPAGLEPIIIKDNMLFKCSTLNRETGVVFTKVLNCDRKTILGEASQQISVVDNFLVVNNNDEFESDSIRRFDGSVVYAGAVMPKKVSLALVFDKEASRYVVYDRKTRRPLEYLNTVGNRQILNHSKPEDDQVSM